MVGDPDAMREVQLFRFDADSIIDGAANTLN
jgi:hypothetical protein